MKLKSLSTALGVGLLVGTGAAGPYGPLTPIDQAVPLIVGRAIDQGPINPSQSLFIVVSLPPARPQALRDFCDSVSNPFSPTYRQFIGPEEVGSRFGLSNDQISKVTGYLRSQGLTIESVTKNRMTIVARGTADQVQTAFGTTIDNYRAAPVDRFSPEHFFANQTPPKVPASIKPFILGIAGLESYNHGVPRNTHILTPPRSAGLYDVNPFYSASHHGEGRTMAITNFDGFLLSNVPLYIARYGLPVPPGGANSNISVVKIDGGSGSGTPTAEGDLDIQMEIGMAPLATMIIYDGGGTAADYLATLAKEADDNLADVISDSWGWGLDNNSYEAGHNSHLTMTAEGITYLVASGDEGTKIEPYPYPNFDPDVLMVGGTFAVVDNTTGARVSENGWNGSGSGWVTESTTFNVLPSWLKGTGVPTGTNFRLFPDVALHACGSQQVNGTGAYEFYLNGGLHTDYWGTSFASPNFAGILTVLEQQVIAKGGLFADAHGHKRLGRINDYIYSQNGRSEIWHDITDGDAGKLPDMTEAVGKANWDFVTGWGVPDFNQLANRMFPTVSSVSPTSAAAGGSAFTLTVNGADFTPNCVVQWQGANLTTTYVSKTKLTASVPSVKIAGAGTAVIKVLSTGLALSTTSANFLVVGLSNVSVAPSTVIGGVSATGTVTLTANAPTGGEVVTLHSLSTAITVPASVTVAAGSSSKTFTVSTAVVSATAIRQFTATRSTVTKTATMTLTAGLKSLTITPNQVVGGVSTVGKATLLGAAPSGGAVVHLSSNSTAVTLPATVTIPSGATNANFTINTALVAATSIRAVTANYGSLSYSAAITLTPGLKSFTISPTSVVGGTNATGTITLLGPAPAGGQVVNVSSASSIIHVPATVTVPAGATSKTFTIGTSTVTATYVRPVTVTLGSVTLTAYLMVHP